MDAVVKWILLSVSTFGFLSACSKGYQSAAQQTATTISNAAGCADFQTRFWDQMYKNAESETKPVGIETVRSAIRSSVQEQDGSIALAQNLSDKVVDALSVVEDTMNPGDKELTREERMGKVAALELGVSDTVELAQAHNRLETVMPQIEQTRSLVHVACVTSQELMPPVAKDDNAFYEQLKKSRTPASYGAIKAMSTAYQRCDMDKLPPMTRAVPYLQGIIAKGKNNDGGTMRNIADLAALQKTHPYLQDFIVLNNSCFNVHDRPLIYDFGGKPYATSDPASGLDFFGKKDTGSNALGIDCSGFVFSSLASAGLKLKSTAPLRAAQVYNFGSSAYNNPKANGLDCIQPIKMSGVTTLQAGDIVAGAGHVIMIDRVSADPFGISQIQSLAACDTQVSSSNFQFTISQSSASQGGIGINRYDGKEYLSGVSSYKAGLERIAKYACYSKFKAQSSPALSTINVVRHTGTAQCVAQEISLAHSSCVASCQE